MKCSDLEDVAQAVQVLMAGFPASWCVAGGWAIDLFLGRVTREHQDVELAIFRQDQACLHRHFSDWAFDKIVDGRREPWADGEMLSLPVHEIHGRSPRHQTHTLEFLLNERKGDNWLFRRQPSITRPLEAAVLRAGYAVPVLCPEIVLLYKAKVPRAKDKDDFRTVRDAIAPSARSWLQAALQAVHPGHPWIAALGERDGSA